MWLKKKNPWTLFPVSHYYHRHCLSVSWTFLEKGEDGQTNWFVHGNLIKVCSPTEALLSYMISHDDFCLLTALMTAASKGDISMVRTNTQTNRRTQKGIANSNQFYLSVSAILHWDLQCVLQTVCLVCSVQHLSFTSWGKGVMIHHKASSLNHFLVSKVLCDQSYKLKCFL